MKWFKHESTFASPKIKMLKRKHGAVGYAVYFQIIELIASNIEKDNFDDWGFLPDAYSNEQEFLADELGVGIEALQAILTTCFSLNLLEEKNGRIYSEKVLLRCDDYIERIKKQVQTKSKQSRKKVKTKSDIRIEEEREEEKEIEQKENKKRTSIDSLTDKDFEDIEEIYHVPRVFVLSKLDDLRNYCERTGKTYKNYKAALRDFVKRDAIKINQEVAVQNRKVAIQT